MRYVLISLCCLTGFFYSCKSLEISYETNKDIETVSVPEINQREPDRLYAGFAKVDITPLPGKALAGYSLLSGEATGVRHHLYSNILYLSPVDGQDVIIIQMDLFSGSLLLQRAIAEKAEEIFSIPASNIILIGTHTHSGPGNYLGSRMYNQNHSANRGFDRDYFTFLARRIFKGIEEARGNLVPACLSAGKRTISGVTRNRSLDAHLQNREIVDAPRKPDDFEAVNREMTMLRFDRIKEDGKTEPMGAMTSFSIHGTAVPASNRYYSSDVFTYISRELEWHWKAEDQQNFTHLVTSGVHGDVSPAYRENLQGFPEAQRLGVAIGREAIDLHKSLEAGLTDDISITTLSTDLNLLNRDSDEYIDLAERAYIGYQATGGAEDGMNMFMRRFSVVREGNPADRISIENQGYKRPVLGKLQNIIIPADHFPHDLMLQILMINDFAIVPLPFEVTGMAGQRIEESLLDLTGLWDINIISCSNGYFGYVTTEEEYGEQHYEGASNLYGPETLSFLIRNLGDLAIKKKSSIGEMDFSPGPILQQPLDVPSIKINEDDLSEVAYSKSHSPELESFWSFRWTGERPDESFFTRSQIKIERLGENGKWADFYRGNQKIDDLGYEISIEILGRDRYGDDYLFEARWHSPAEEAPGMFRFSLIDEKGEVYHSSEAFEIVFP